jgi:hypothetical protein
MAEELGSVNQEERLQNHRIAVVTTTFYKEWSVAQAGSNKNADQLRGDLAIETLRQAKEKGYQLMIVDGGSSESFKNHLKGLGVDVHNQMEGGMSASRRQTFKEAAILPGVEVICWIEPEKVSMIENINKAAKPIIEGDADIVIPARTAESFKTYPEQQVISEQKLNRLFSTILRLTGLWPKNSPDMDSSFGPRIFKNDPEILNIFTCQFKLKENSRLAQAVKPDNYSNAIFFPIMLALERKLRVVSSPVDYVHPKIQTEYETGNAEYERKRIDQKNDIVKGAIELARYLINDPQKPSELFDLGNTIISNNE